MYGINQRAQLLIFFPLEKHSKIAAQSKGEYLKSISTIIPISFKDLG